MATTTEAKSPRAQTPFTLPAWPWNHVPQAGIPARPRCQSIVSDSDRAAGVKLIEEYRAQEAIAIANDIEGRQKELTQCKGVPAELLKREISNCDHGKWLAAQDRLAGLRREAFELVKPIFKRLVKSLSDELDEAALATEGRLNKAGIALQAPDHLDSAGRHTEGEWALHDDMLCKALWSQRNIVEKTFGALVESGDGIPATQFLCSGENQTPFFWVH
jgi:hypothetical protein